MINTVNLFPIADILAWLNFPKSFSTFLLSYSEIPAKLQSWSRN